MWSFKEIIHYKFKDTKREIRYKIHGVTKYGLMIHDRMKFCMSQKGMD